MGSIFSSDLIDEAPVRPVTLTIWCPEHVFANFLEVKFKKKKKNSISEWNHLATSEHIKCRHSSSFFLKYSPIYILHTANISAPKCNISPFYGNLSISTLPVTHFLSANIQTWPFLHWVTTGVHYRWPPIERSEHKPPANPISTSRNPLHHPHSDMLKHVTRISCNGLACLVKRVVSGLLMITTSDTLQYSERFSWHFFISRSLIPISWMLLSKVWIFLEFYQKPKLGYWLGKSHWLESNLIVNFPGLILIY